MKIMKMGLLVVLLALEMMALCDCVVMPYDRSTSDHGNSGYYGNTGYYGLRDN